MKNSSYRKILYFIGFVIVITLVIQGYWNYRNYQNTRQQLINEVQISLDNAVEEYYASGARKRTRFTYLDAQDASHKIFPPIRKRLPLQKMEGVDITVFKDTGHLREGQVFTAVDVLNSVEVDSAENVEILDADSLTGKLHSMVGQILISMNQDTVDIKKLDSLVERQLARKGIDVDFGLVFKRKDDFQQRSRGEMAEIASLKTESKSTWLPPNSSLSLYFTNETAMILKQNMFGILLSGLLLGSVVGCLLFLLKVINNQKQLAEVKNDFISNLTHEFKTPIATIKVAMEGILYFNNDNDPAKTANYVKTSNAQVDKLNSMVEKLLEVATLNSSQLQLEKEEISLVPTLEGIVQKYEAMAPEKSFDFRSNQDDIILIADPFHLENAFNNILDNAVKYGGNRVMITVKAGREQVEIKISDNGNVLTKAQANQVFDKFYRVPKGNTHDVKGFGIGLYYTKQIIERHGGSIAVDLNNNTNFIIHLPYER